MTIYVPPTFIKLLAALSSYKEIKKRCKGRYDFENGGNYCKCEAKEVCQVVLSEVLGKTEAALTEKRFRLAFEELTKAGVIHVRKVNNPPGKPQIFYSLPDDWAEALKNAIIGAVEEEAEELEFDRVGRR